MTPDLFHLAAKFHRALPERIREYLHSRGIPDEIINRHFLGWNGRASSARYGAHDIQDTSTRLRT